MKTLEIDIETFSSTDLKRPVFINMLNPLILKFSCLVTALMAERLG
jgi:hypothetical protein